MVEGKNQSYLIIQYEYHSSISEKILRMEQCLDETTIALIGLQVVRMINSYKSTYS